jgi:hypothetical protein
MIRLTVFAGILAIGMASFGSQAAAQSPNPALLAPSGGRPGARAHGAAVDLPSHPSEGWRDTSEHEVPRGYHLSHPRVHGL